MDADEPPDNSLHFRRLSIPHSGELPSRDSDFMAPSPNKDRKESLLTQALLTSPTLRSLKSPTSPVSRTTSSVSNCSTTSIASMAELTSDGGITSPARTNTPSPPLLPMNLIGSGFASPKALHLDTDINDITPRAGPRFATSTTTSEHNDQPTRRRCITFACGVGAQSQERNTSVLNVDGADRAGNIQPNIALRRPCMLRFACPSRTSSGVVHKAGTDRKISPVADVKVIPEATPKDHQQGDSQPVVETSPLIEPNGAKVDASTVQEVPKAKTKYTSEGLRFHEFASRYLEEDEWLNQQSAPRHKITVSDTLRKEDAIRKLGQEAEEEALEEENANAEAELEEELDDIADNGVIEDDENRDDDNEDDENASAEDLDSDNSSDGGNESDNEEGFADSDEESDVDSEYYFWRPGTTTAATSTDNLEFIRPKTQRTASDSSIESVVNFIDGLKRNDIDRRSSRPRAIKMRPGTPDLPDSTDFVCGTLDEDRPLEAAYISCIQQRRLAKQARTPRDYDPSFPTSELDDEDEVNDDDLVATEASDEHMWIIGRPDDSDVEEHCVNRKTVGRKRVKSPAPLSRRLRSPPPAKNSDRIRSPPPAKHRVKQRSSTPRCQLGDKSPRRVRPSPLVHVQNLMPPRFSLQPSVSEMPRQKDSRVDVTRLAQGLDATYTKSLPKTPNPFWRYIRRASTELLEHPHVLDFEGKSAGLTGELHHSRGPIDIVHGLENKRSLRREKFLRQHCRNGGKEKERRCQPGKGAERMRELGLERAGRCKAFGQPQKLMLSI